ncbi:MAG: acyltransferase [Planctomycetota bacterium]
MRTRSLRSFDLFRIGAMAIVAIHHALSISDLPTPGLFNGRLIIGQIGVSVFCIISGFFSMHSRGTPPLAWLRRRLTRVYVPYWITLTLLIVANQFSGYKPMNPELIFSQYLGTGYFTHPSQLLGIHFWFISLILLCYGLAVFVRLMPALVVPILGLVLCTPVITSLFAAHIVSFLIGAALSLFWRERSFAVVASSVAVACLLGALYPPMSHLVYSSSATIALCLCRIPMGNSSHWLTLTSERTYEFFLVHGPVYLILRKALHVSRAVNLTFGTVVAVLAAIVLERVSRPLVHRLQGGQAPSNRTTDHSLASHPAS